MMAPELMMMLGWVGYGIGGIWEGIKDEKEKSVLMKGMKIGGGKGISSRMW
jgi:hypothetical protein